MRFATRADSPMPSKRHGPSSVPPVYVPRPKSIAKLLAEAVADDIAKVCDVKGDRTRSNGAVNQNELRYHANDKVWC